MCGIAGVISALEESPSGLDGVLGRLEERVRGLGPEAGLERWPQVLTELEAQRSVLRREGSLWQIARDKKLAERVSGLANRLDELEQAGPRPDWVGSALEAWNAVSVRLRDLSWLLREDLQGLVQRVCDLMGAQATQNRHLFYHGWKLAATLSSLGRLEVRGRDSLGLSVLVSARDAAAVEAWRKTYADDLAKRTQTRDFVNGGVLAASEAYLFTFKVAQEVGALGDNVARLQHDISTDRMFLSLLSEASVESNVFGHTRWASNGVISEQNCHPVTQETIGCGPQSYWISAALNGDVDNYQALRARYEAQTGERISPSITTDTKIIPMMVAWHYRETGDIDEAFRRSVAEFEGSLAIVMHTSLAPHRTWLALAGSGQSLCVGLMDEGCIVASELYGVVELAERFVRMDGTNERVSGDVSTRGQIFAVNARHASAGLSAIDAMSFDGTPLKLTDNDVKMAEITTRDINRAGFPHYLLKEIHEAPRSIQRTLKGKFRLHDGRVTWLLDEATVPHRALEAMRQHKIRRIICMGQGTAAVAGDAIANYMGRLLEGTAWMVSSTKATEFSGYHMGADLSDTLVIAVSQSGTTTDTNRTIDLCRSRGATVLGIVNRRNSDLVYKVDGVVYTSDGRDIEMSVASTKAFYSQVTAGYLLALYFGQQLGVVAEHAVAEQLAELAHLPELMAGVLARHGEVCKLAEAYAPTRRDWAVAGSGFNRAAANEIRIKLSELCYKSIASDSIEDKKHIDLSSEPLILVCTAGLPPVALKDAIKEVAIFKSHKSCPIVIAAQSAQGFEPYAAGLITVPDTSDATSVLLNTLVGHLWGYYSALAIDEGASLLRQARAALVKMSLSTDNGQAASVSALRTAIQLVVERLRHGKFNSSLSSSTTGQLTLLLQYVLGRLPLSSFAEDFGGEATPAHLYDLVLQTLTTAISELSRPVDAIKHQAKTITVGISRPEEKLEGAIFDGLAGASVAAEMVSYKDLMLLQALNVAVRRVPGTTRYRLSQLGELGQPTDATRIEVEGRTGVAVNIASRTDRNPLLTGAKQWVVRQRSAYVGVGRSDGRPIVILPLYHKGTCDGLLLLHIEFADALPQPARRKLMQQQHNRYDAWRALVTEANVPWRDDWLDRFTVQELVTSPVEDLVREVVRQAHTPVG
ncbi:MAG TPA: SIS domain-containing protein [Candidatus Xenobia bacterium]|jgi:glucosamine--fructose-6-phosphate aminotransferase (isomerizing)